MPRDSSGDFALPAGNPVVAGEIVSSDWANTTLGDVAQALTDSLDRDGRGGMRAPFKFSDGAVGAPGAAWQNEPTTGLYRAGAGDLRVAVLGQDQMRWSSANGTQYWDGSSWQTVGSGGGGAANFLALTDTPSSYAGNENFMVAVNGSGTALAFVEGFSVTGTPNNNDTIRFNGSAWVSNGNFEVDSGGNIVNSGNITSGGITSSGTSSFSGSVDFSGASVTGLPASATTFVALTDTPANYTSASGKFVAVNGTGNGLEFVDAPAGGGNVANGTAINQMIRWNGSQWVAANAASLTSSGNMTVASLTTGGTVQANTVNTTDADFTGNVDFTGANVTGLSGSVSVVGTPSSGSLIAWDGSQWVATFQSSAGMSYIGSGTTTDSLSVNRVVTDKILCQGSGTTDFVIHGYDDVQGLMVDRTGAVSFPNTVTYTGTVDFTNATVNGLPGGGVSDFLGLSDTPANYTGASGQFVAVNGTGDGLEFVAAPAGGNIANGTAINQMVRWNGSQWLSVNSATLNNSGHMTAVKVTISGVAQAGTVNGTNANFTNNVDFTGAAVTGLAISGTPEGNSVISGGSTNGGVTYDNAAPSFAPVTTGVIDLGTATNRWLTPYSVNALNTSSDESLKRNIEPINLAQAETLLKGITPRQYQWADERMHQEVMFGFTAQDVASAATLAGINPELFYFYQRTETPRMQGGDSFQIDPETGEELLDDEGNPIPTPVEPVIDPTTNAPVVDVDYGLAYSEFIAPMVAVIQNLLSQRDLTTNRIAALEEDITLINSEIATANARLAALEGVA